MSSRRSGLRTKADQSVAEIREETKSSAPAAGNSDSYLPALGVYGFGEIEPVILAALVTEDPLLLIGASGTGKTYLLNSLSEALNFEHRHYNASLISFDDLVGFPYPDPEGTGVRFLETPATVWCAESVLIDEISRSKPEQQNRLFSLVHERRVQGIALPKLRYRWAAMNPCSSDQDGDENYTGSEPLDPALADRFALFVNALDWDALSDEERRRIAEPVGESRIADDGGRLKVKIEPRHEPARNGDPNSPGGRRIPKHGLNNRRDLLPGKAVEHEASGAVGVGHVGETLAERCGADGAQDFRGVHAEALLWKGFST